MCNYPFVVAVHLIEIIIYIKLKLKFKTVLAKLSLYEVDHSN